MLRLMRAFGFASVALTTAALAAAGAQLSGRIQPGWPGVFVSPGMYSVRYEKPIVGKEGKTYQQKAIYDWSGGRFEILEITLARDPAFKDKYAAHVLRKEKNPPKELQINDKKAWQWEFPREGGKLDQLTRRLVIRYLGTNFPCRHHNRRQ
jgi:hypothetical protein